MSVAYGLLSEINPANYSAENYARWERKAQALIAEYFASAVAKEFIQTFNHNGFATKQADGLKDVFRDIRLALELTRQLSELQGAGDSPDVAKLNAIRNQINHFNPLWPSIKVHFARAAALQLQRHHKADNSITDQEHEWAGLAHKALPVVLLAAVGSLWAVAQTTAAEFGAKISPDFVDPSYLASVEGVITLAFGFSFSFIFFKLASSLGNWIDSRRLKDRKNPLRCSAPFGNPPNSIATDTQPAPCPDLVWAL